MDSRDFDNIAVTSLPNLLDEHLVLKRYFPLIPYKGKIISVLISLGINDKYQYFEAPQEIRDTFAKEMKFDCDRELLFIQFLHLYDFKVRRISDVSKIEGFTLKQLSVATIKTSKEYMQYCIGNGIEDAAKKLNTDVTCARELFCLCDLMRLPGVKWLRAKLYYDCGFNCVQSFARQDVDRMRNEIAAYIQTNCVQRTVPLVKEVATQIAVAAALPHLCVR